MAYVPTPIDFNQTIIVKLTDLGKKVYSDRVFEATGKFQTVGVDEEGQSTMSLVVFMNVYGNKITSVQGMFESQPCFIIEAPDAETESGQPLKRVPSPKQLDDGIKED